MWPNATFVRVANEIHVTALYDYERCASRIVRRFIRTGSPGDTSCAASTPTINVVEAFPQSVHASPAARSAGLRDRSRPLDRRIAWAAAQTVADAFNRWWNELYGGVGVGLRGGSYRIRGAYYSLTEPLMITFHETRFVTDVVVSGIVVWHRRAARAIGRLWVDAPETSGWLRIVFDTDRRGDLTRIRGRLEGRRATLVTDRA